MAPLLSSSLSGARAFLSRWAAPSRIPLFTRAILAAVVALWLVGAVVGAVTSWDIRAWGSLVPDKFGLASLYRLNTFPLVHLGFLHTLVDVLALTPLLERFESEHGTLTSLALFVGPLTTLPALLYLLIEKTLLRANNAVMGSSIWVFLLLGVEAIRTYRSNPYISIGTHSIPTWITPLVLTLCVAALMPSTSLLGHLCGLAVGYVYGLGYLKFLAPPEKALRWIEARLNLFGRLPHYVSVDQKTYGRFGVLPTSSSSSGPGGSGTPLGLVSGGQRLGP